MRDGSLFEPGPSERVVAACGTLSSGQNQVDRAKNNYTQVIGGWVKPHATAHLLGRLPAGGNVLCLEGNSVWRRFERMVIRTDGSEPAFWW